jgi:putative peptide zinc metalloprotease protein
MRDAPPTFSESWFRVATQRIALRPSVRIRRQNYRGQRWMVLENSLDNNFFRMHPASYEFVARLRPDRTVEEVWRECLDRFPNDAPGQEAVIQLLGQLYHAGLLQYNLSSDTEQLFKRYERTRQREIRSRLLNVMFLRIPIFDPDRFLKAAMPIARLFLSPLGLLLWLAVVGTGLKLAIDDFPALRDQSQGILSPDNLLLLYLSTAFIKTIHEFGHAFFCRRYGGEVHTMGVMFMIFTPMPYVDASSSWGFRYRYQRLLVGAGGMIFELFVAAIAAMIWRHTGSGVLHSITYNMMFVASVSTLIFNLNPLMRFDGYYLLSDVLEIPNLNQRAMRQLAYWAEKYLLGVEKAEPAAQSRKESIWLTVFGIGAGLYRIVVFGGILLFIADRFMLLGIIMAAICAIAWVFTPIVGLVRYLASSPRLDRCRTRAVSVTVGVAACLVALLQFTPLPSHFRAPGVLRSPEECEVHNNTAGYLEEILAKPGSVVAKGEPLLRIVNQELELNLRSALATRDEIEAQILQAMEQQQANLRPLKSRLEAAQQNIARLEYDRSELIVHAPQAGTWISPHISDSKHRWLLRGANLGLVTDPEKFQFIAVIAQTEADRIFAHPVSSSEVRLRGQAQTRFEVANLKMIPGERRILPSPALGWAGGGPIPVAQDDPDGRKAIEPFFEVRGDLTADSKTKATLLDGRSGEIRFDLPAEPLLPRWTRQLRQLLQKRYQI